MLYKTSYDSPGSSKLTLRSSQINLDEEIEKEPFLEQKNNKVMTLVGHVLPLSSLVSLDQDEECLYLDLQEDAQRLQEILQDKSNARKLGCLVFLFKLSLLDKHAASVMQNFNSFWDEAWRNLGQDLYDREYATNPLLDSFSLLLGKFLYSQYEQSLEEQIGSNDEADILQRSCLWYAANTFFNYQAIDRLCWEMLCGRYADKIQPLVFDELMTLANHAAQYYLSPGFALLAKVTYVCAIKLPGNNIYGKVNFYAIAYAAVVHAENTLEISNDLVQIAYDFEEFSEINRDLRSFSAVKEKIVMNMETVLLREKNQRLNFFNSMLVKSSRKDKIETCIKQTSSILLMSEIQELIGSREEKRILPGF